MLFPERMKDLTILVHDDHTDDVVESLHQEGVVEISSVDRDTDVMKVLDEDGGRIPDIVGKCTDYDMKLASVLDVFGRIEEEDGSIMEMISPPEPEKIEREKKTLPQIFDEIDALLEKNGERIKELDDELTSIEDELADLESLKEDLISIENLDIDLSLLGESSFTVIKVGKTPDPSKLKEALSDVEESFYSLKKTEEGEYVAVTGCYIRRDEEFEAALREAELKTLDLEGLEGDPKEALGDLYTKVDELEEKRERLMEELKEIKDGWEKKYLALREELDIYRERKEVIKNFGRTQATSVIKAWAPEDKVEEVDEIVEKSSGGHSELIDEEPEDPEEVPISLDNPKIIKPFELLTNMFAPPQYDEVDPTFILAPAFVLFFGLMLGDVVYGALILLTSIVLLKGMGRVDEGTKRFAWVLFGISISTIIFGVFQGSYLGPEKTGFPNLLGLFGLPYPVYLNSLSGDGPLTLLILSLLIGLAYLNIGIFLSLVQFIHRSEYKQILLNNVSWWLLQPGGFILISGKLFGWFGSVYTPVWYYIAGVMSAVGLILLLLRAKGLSFFELTGFIGDFLSFARILALGLATAGIALTVNVLSGLIASSSMPVIMALPVLLIGGALLVRGHLKNEKMQFLAGAGIAVLGGLGLIDPVYPFLIIAMIVALGGHLANAVLQALGSFVHSLRLQYVEFFGQFYEGGGSPFSIFSPEREHTTLKDEKDVME
ncbi:MAG: V-type ATP synthase subunit I [Candidatus Thermoplasmatota archaeon]|nr:V-type ATP synthase subunit I [Candidatus Thermoplasmatota archaeon]